MGIYEFHEDDARRFAQEQGIGYIVKGDELVFKICPYCRNNTDKKNKFAINRHTGAFNCLRASCGAKGNMITLSRDFDFSLGRDVDEYYRRTKHYKSIRHFPVPETKPEAIQYLESRGISAEVAKKYHIGVRKDNSDVLVFPFYDEDGELQFIKYRNTKPTKGQSKEWCEPDCKPILFGMDQCIPSVRELILTEGQIDSLSCAQAGLANVISVPTGCNGFTWVPYCWDFLSKYDTLIVFGDHEHGRITLLDEMRKRFHGAVKHVRPEDYKDCKDANEILQKYGAEAVAYAVINAVPVNNPHFEQIKDVKRRSLSEMEHFDTGIGELNKIVGGFYMGTVVLLTGERGLGKSTLASQFGAFALKAGYSVFFYSGELPDFIFREWFDRQVAGDRHINKLVSNLGYTDYKVDGNVIPKIAEWYENRALLYCNDIADDDDEEETIIKTIESAVKQFQCKVVIIDNLMTAMTDDLRSDLYRQQSIFVNTLTKLARTLDIFILLVAHPRKNSFNRFDNDDVSGSGNITNLASVVLRYTKPDKDDELHPDRILQVLKNRMSGRTNYDGIPLYFQDSSKRISRQRLFDWEFGWESDEDKWSEPDDLDIPF